MPIKILYIESDGRLASVEYQQDPGLTYSLKDIVNAIFGDNSMYTVFCRNLELSSTAIIHPGDVLYALKPARLPPQVWRQARFARVKRS